VNVSLAKLRRLPVERILPWVVLLPVPAWFLISVLFTTPAAWHAVYRAGDGQPPAVDTFEREMSHLWSGKYFADVAGDLEPASFSAEFEACLNQEYAVTIPFMLVADGTARFSLDGVEQLTTPAKPSSDRQVIGKHISLKPGPHHLRVEFRARNRPSVGLLASFDGAAPQALGSGKLAAGTKISRPKPGADPCGD
jgi:hypothetical protein